MTTVFLRSLPIAALLVADQAAAHLPALYGSRFLRAPAAEEQRVENCAARPSPSDDPAAHRDRIAELERQQGAYGAALTEPLADLARHYRGTGDYDEAIDLYSRALHLVRINDGLDSARQLALLEALADTYRQQGDLNALDRVRQQVFRLSSRGKDPGDAGVAAATLDFIAWQREAWSLGLDGSDRRRLLEAYLGNEQLLEALTSVGEGSPAHREALFSQLSNLYLIMGSDFVESGAHAVSSALEMEPSQAGSTIYVRQRIARIQQSGVDRGEELLENLLTLTGPEDIEAYGSLRLELGDWFQWNGDYHRAATEYAGLERALREGGRADLLEQWLGAPAELPVNRRFQAYHGDGNRLGPGGVTARFRVSGRGLVDDIEVLAEPVDDPGGAGRVKRMLVETHFRPRFVDGSGQAVAVVERRYRFIPAAGTGGSAGSLECPRVSG
jgi:tetratricopeptide (TPR) repeat protein